MPFSVVQCQQIMQLIQAGMKDVTAVGSSHVVGSSHLAGSILLAYIIISYTNSPTPCES